jgi:histidine triad (HIT) family protein
MAFISAHQWTKYRDYVLIIPNQYFENLYELPDEVGGKIHSLSRRSVLAKKAVYRCDGVSTRQHNEPAGNQDVWHYHLHVFSRYEQDNLYTGRYTLLPPCGPGRICHSPA